MAYMCPKCQACHGDISCEDFLKFQKIQYDIESQRVAHIFPDLVPSDDLLLHQEAENEIVSIACQLADNPDNSRLLERLKEQVGVFRRTSIQIG